MLEPRFRWLALWLAVLLFSQLVANCESFAASKNTATTAHKRLNDMLSRTEKQAPMPPVMPQAPPLSQALKARLSLRRQERLQKLVAQAGVCSRRSAEQMILDGRVTVNGRIVKTLGSKASATNDVIQIDAQRIFVRPEEEAVWVAYNKPPGVVCSMEDDERKFTVAAAIPRARELRLLPVGRLDKDSTGLLLMTNDNTWIHTLTHPAFGHRKRYHVTVGNGCPTVEAITPIRKGLKVPAEKQAYRPVEVELLEHDDETAKLDVLLSEGRNRQIRQMFEHIGHPVLRLKRVEFGNIKLGKLKRGDWRFLTAVEIAKLKQGVRIKLKEAQPPSLAPINPTPHRNAGGSGAVSSISSRYSSTPAVRTRNGPTLKKLTRSH